ncbi:Thioredoxin domain protein [Gloeothece citriformis PCC 7424]|uniref:Thioredoxin domain protein n=1 Tax=Gloeothece citriformis (strain PCC 7424) TaxID=65393 RepID=B7KGX2_GLOC7|nr:thioredoxin domain-containing protein [Gloeothece citriformis]ACK73459.1 Thioredoxin domain protein [Gloeothece citriformis PCC 7424]
MNTQKELIDLISIVSNSDLPILLYVYTTYCGPSRLMNSILEKIRNQMEQELKIIKIDSEDYPDFSNQYKIHALPILLLFKNGQLVARLETESTEKLMSENRLIERLKSLV